MAKDKKTEQEKEAAKTAAAEAKKAADEREANFREAKRKRTEAFREGMKKHAERKLDNALKFLDDFAAKGHITDGGAVKKLKQKITDQVVQHLDANFVAPPEE